MAQRTYIETVDDFDGETPAETVRFSLDGRTYEVDLNETNAANFRETLAPYIEVGRRIAVPRRKRSTTP